jgi:AcrR family transcriptional regulator
VPRAGLDRTTIIDRAAELLDQSGADGLSLAAVAASLGVKTPSLYKHIDGMPGLQRGVTLRAKADIGQAIGQAAIGRSRDEAVTEMCVAYRTWALAHPGQYALTVRAPAGDDEKDAAASSAVIDVIYAVLAGYGLRDDDAVHATRFFRAALHGFVALETGGAFALAVDLEVSFERLVGSIVTALSTWAPA